MTTPWLPILNPDRPRYVSIADSIASDLASGKLSNGDRLPPQRELAWRLGVTVGTVTRAYQEAERRGLLVGEVGRGSYLRDPAGTQIGLPSGADHGIIELHVAGPPVVQQTSDLDCALTALMKNPQRTNFLDYLPPRGLPEHRRMAKAWLKRSGMDVPAENIVMTAGAHSAIIASLGALVHAGEHIFAEPLTYPTILPIARLLGIHLHGLQMDEHGLVPESLEQACRTHPLKVLYLVPTLHNPTTITLGIERRQAIVDIARRYNLNILEDDIFRLLAQSPLPPTLHSMAPERTYHITSLSKSLAPSLRIGFVVTPPGRTDPVAEQQLIGGSRISGLTAELARAWIESDAGERTLGNIRNELAQRRLIALSVFAGRTMRCEPGAMFCWLSMPEQWRAGEFARAALADGIKVTPGSAFATMRRADDQAVRICLGPPRTRECLKEALTRLNALIDRGPQDSFRSIA